MAFGSHLTSASEILPPRQLRVELSATLPVDPLYMKSMAEYDLSLLFWRSWFTYDKGRRAEHGVIKSWAFDGKTGEYTFTADDLKWSDGSPLLARQLIENLERVSHSRTQYAKAVNAIVDFKTLHAIDNRTFKFRTVNGKSSDTLFNQLGSVFFSVVHPKDFGGPGEKLKQNTLALGPYRLDRQSAQELRFGPNPNYALVDPLRPQEILVRYPDPSFSLENFLSGKTWANYYQTNTLLAQNTAQLVQESHYPYWTRGFDRVSLLKPLGEGPALARRRATLIQLGAKFAQLSRFHHPLQVALARSLQPVGYPLHKDCVYSEKTSTPFLTEVRILSYQVPQLALMRPWLEEQAQALKIKIQWMIVTQREFLSMNWDESQNDFVLFSFGVADPEPTTWLSLVLGEKFVSYDPSDKETFEHLMRETNVEKQVNGYRDLIVRIGEKGGYLPIFHGATISLGTPEMSFAKIDPLDETVDYSKIQFSK